MIKHKIKKLVAVIVVVLMTFGSILETLSAVAVVDNIDLRGMVTNPKSIGLSSIRELYLRRDRNVKQYYLGDGMTQMVAFGKSIHRKNKYGDWIDIDNNLSLVEDENGKTLFSTKDGWASFSSDTSDGAIVSIRDNEYSIAMSFVNDGLDSQMGAEVKSYESPNPSNQFESVEEAIEYYNNFSSKSIVSYYNICDDTDLEFILLGNDIKSNIVIHSADVSNTFFFKLEIEGLTPLTLECGQLFLVDETTGELVYEISSPYMIDAKGEMSNDLIQTITEMEDNSYLLEIEVDNEWINSQDRCFPITIDPYLSEPNNYDTYINSSSPNQNYGENTALNISDTCISFFRHNFISVPEDSVITQAYFYVAYYFDSNITSGSMDVGLYQVSQDWGEYTWTWNIANQYTNLGLSSSTISSKSWNGNSGAYENTPVWETFTVTNLVNSWFNGTDNYGVAIKRESGTISSAHIKSFESGSAHRPYYSVLYREPIITEGVYYIKNVSSNLYMETENGDYTSGTLVKQKAKVNGDIKQLFKITYIDTYNNDRFYDIRPMTNNGLGLYAPYISGSNHDVKVNTMSTSDGWYDVSHTQKWAIQTHATFGYVTLHNALNNNGGYLSSPNSTSGTTLVTILSFNNNCRWVLEPYTGGALSNVVMTSYAPTIAIGDCIDYDAIMYDDQIGVNGPVSFSVVETNYSPTNKATINSTTGQMTALLCGNVKIRISYYGNSNVWDFNVVIIPSYGCRPYYEITSQTNEFSYINCLGYAINYCLGNATQNTKEELSFYSWCTWNSIFQSNQVQNANDVLDVFKPVLEYKIINSFGAYDCEEVTNNGGVNAYLNNNQWLIVMRAIYFSNEEWDVHFWYRTNTGEWVNKHGINSESEKLTSDLPTDDYSAGWVFDDYYYYDSDLVYYRITGPSSGE